MPCAHAPLALFLLMATTAVPPPPATAVPAAIAADDTAATASHTDDADFPVVLASFSTTLIGSSAARTHNIRLAAAALDNSVIDPGAELSFNATVGARTTERGYLVAPVILR